MPVRRLKPYEVGDTAVLSPEGSTAGWLDVTAPDGSEARYRRAVTGSVRVALTQPGVWRYRWGQTEQGTLEVVAPVPVMAKPEPAPVRWRPGV